MSRAFVREDDLESRSEFEEPERPLPPRPILITAEGRKALEKRLADLEAQEKTPAEEDAGLASESAQLARQRERRWLETVLAAATTPPPAAGDEIAFGARVVIKNPEGEEHRYHLVGEVEADPKSGAISWRSPLGRALMGFSVGDLVVWQRPAGEVELEIVALDWD